MRNEVGGYATRKVPAGCHMFRELVGELVANDNMCGNRGAERGTMWLAGALFSSHGGLLNSRDLMLLLSSILSTRGEPQNFLPY